MSMSKTLAVSTYPGGLRRMSSIRALPFFRSFLSWARRTRISFARRRASILWSSERTGAWTWVFALCMARHSNSALSRFKCEFFAAI